MQNHTEIPKKGLAAKKSIMVVEDSPDLLMVNKLMLEIEGYKVVTAASGNAALTLLETIEAPGLILLDMRMENMSGPEFLDVLEKQRPETFKNVPVVYVTGMEQVPTGKHKGFLRKPVDRKKLLETVRQFLDDRDGMSDNGGPYLL